MTSSNLSQWPPKHILTWKNKVCHPVNHYWDYYPGGRFKNTDELLNLRALKFSPLNKICLSHCMGKIFCVEFQRYPLKFHTNIFPIHWKIWFVFNIEILRAPRFKSSYTIARPPHQPPVILYGTLEQGWAPLTCGCWQINSILANIGRRNSIRILNQYPFWWNILKRE